ncbi:MAG TPA: DUF4097 family beta strand repeat-containing protein [Chryseosolibacter sp.]|nr:DUF4097 family beta strand repeat-containing protein [Chryseosolibacter sp.]
MNKKFLIISIFLIGIGLLLVTASITRAQSSNEFAVPLSDPSKRAKIKAHLNYGSITVKGTARKDVLVRYESETEEDEERDRDDDSRAGLKRIGGGGMDLEVTESSNEVKIHSNSWHHRTNLEIEIPSGSDLQLHTYNGGDLIVTNVQGEVALSNYNGEITALNISGSVVASTYNGEIKVTLDKVTPDTPMSFSTFNGDIDLTFPASLKATLKMKTEQGELLTGFDNVNITSSGPVKKTDSKAGVYKVIVDDWKTAEINGGGPEITMKNYNGDILVRKK